MEMISLVDVLENIKRQLEEIGVLQAIFCGDEELIFENPSLISDLENLVHSGSVLDAKSKVSVLHILVRKDNYDGGNNAEMTFRVQVELSSDYPGHALPNFHVSCDAISRTDTASFNKKLEEFLSTIEFGECIVLDVINFIKLEAEEFVLTETESQHKVVATPSENEKTPELCSIVLKMHHIYSIQKRKQLLSWAEEHSLTGFSLPGKPGVVYAEGAKCDVDVYFKRLRALSWQRMTLELEEKLESLKDLKFTMFNEMEFDVRGKRGYHMDMGQFKEFLLEHGLPHVFPLLFDLK